MSNELNFKILGGTIEISEGRQNYIYIRDFCDKLSCGIADSFLDLYKEKCHRLDHTVDYSYGIAVSVLEPVVKEIMKYLQSKEIFTITKEKIVADILTDGLFEERYDDIVERCATIKGVALDEREMRQMRKDNRSRWVGGGFGMSGAMKGAATAGAMNIASGAIHGIFNGIGNFMSEIHADRQMEKIFRSKDTAEGMASALELDIRNYFIPLGHTLESEGAMSFEWVYKKQADEAETIFNNVIESDAEIDIKYKMMIKVLTLDPFNEDYLEYVFSIAQDTEWEDIIKFADYLCLDISEGVSKRFVDVDIDGKIHLVELTKKYNVDISDKIEEFIYPGNTSDISSIEEAYGAKEQITHTMEMLQLKKTAKHDEIIDVLSNLLFADFIEKVDKAADRKKLAEIHDEINGDKGIDLHADKKQELISRISNRYCHYIEKEIDGIIKQILNLDEDYRVADNLFNKLSEIKDEVTNSFLSNDNKEETFEYIDKKAIKAKTFKNVTFPTASEAVRQRIIYNDFSEQTKLYMSCGEPSAEDIKTKVQESDLHKELIDDLIKKVDHAIQEREEQEYKELTNQQIDECDSMFPEDIFSLSLEDVVKIKNVISEKKYHKEAEDHATAIIKEIEDYHGAQTINKRFKEFYDRLQIEYSEIQKTTLAGYWRRSSYSEAIRKPIYESLCEEIKASLSEKYITKLHYEILEYTTISHKIKTDPQIYSYCLNANFSNLIDKCGYEFEGTEIPVFVYMNGADNKLAVTTSNIYLNESKIPLYKIKKFGYEEGWSSYFKITTADNNTHSLKTDSNTKLKRFNTLIFELQQKLNDQAYKMYLADFIHWAVDIYSDILDKYSEYDSNAEQIIKLMFYYWHDVKSQYSDDILKYSLNKIFVDRLRKVLLEGKKENIEQASSVYEEETSRTGIEIKEIRDILDNAEKTHSNHTIEIAINRIHINEIKALMQALVSLSKNEQSIETNQTLVDKQFDFIQNKLLDLQNAESIEACIQVLYCLSETNSHKKITTMISELDTIKTLIDEQNRTFNGVIYSSKEEAEAERVDYNRRKKYALIIADILNKHIEKCTAERGYNGLIFDTAQERDTAISEQQQIEIIMRSVSQDNVESIKYAINEISKFDTQVKTSYLDQLNSYLEKYENNARTYRGVTYDTIEQAQEAEAEYKITRDIFQQLNMNNEEAVKAAYEKISHNKYNVADDFKTQLEAKLHEFDIQHRTVDGILFDTIEEADKAREELNDIINILNTLDPNNEPTMLQAKTTIEAMTTAVKKKYIGQLNEMLYRYDVNVRTFNGVTYDTREEAALVRTEFDTITAIMNTVSPNDEQSILNAQREIHKLTTNIKQSYLEQLTQMWNAYDLQMRTFEQFVFDTREQAENARITKAEFLNRFNSVDFTVYQNILMLENYIEDELNDKIKPEATAMVEDVKDVIRTIAQIRNTDASITDPVAQKKECAELFKLADKTIPRMIQYRMNPADIQAIRDKHYGSLNVGQKMLNFFKRKK